MSQDVSNKLDSESNEVILKQLETKWNGDASKDEKNLRKVPSSGGLAVFTHYPNINDPLSTYFDPLSTELSPKASRENSFSATDVHLEQREGDQKISSSSGLKDKPSVFASETMQPVKNDAEPAASSLKRSANQVIRHRLEEKCGRSGNGSEETSSDAENERVFPHCELKKRRMSLDKNSVKPGIRRRPSLPALNGKNGGFFKSRTLEESTRMLRSATPMKTLRSRNVECIRPAPKRAGSLATPVAGKRQRSTPSPVLGKRRPKAGETEPSDTTFLKLYLEDSKKLSKEVENSRKMSREKKHKSLPPGILEKWQDSAEDKSNSASDGEMTPLSSIHPLNRRLRFQVEQKSSLRSETKTQGHQSQRRSTAPVISHNSPKPVRK